MNKFERCLWIVSTLNDYGKASLRELNEPVDQLQPEL